MFKYKIKMFKYKIKMFKKLNRKRNIYIKYFINCTKN